jgi:hypothetical protein
MTTNLWRNIVWGSTLREQKLGGLANVKHCAEPKVRDLEGPRLGEKQVLGLEVPMAYPHLVAVINSSNQLRPVSQRRLLVESTFLCWKAEENEIPSARVTKSGMRRELSFERNLTQESRDFAAVHEVHYEIDFGLGCQHVQHVDHVLMTDLFQDGNLSGTDAIHETLPQHIMLLELFVPTVRMNQQTSFLICSVRPFVTMSSFSKILIATSLPVSQ